MQFPALKSYPNRIPSIASAQAKNDPLRYWLNRVAWASIMGLALYYVWRNVGHYLDVRPEAYDYFWPKRAWLWLHLAGGTTAVLLGPLQFVGRLRAVYPQAHRWTGRFYLMGLLCASIGATGLFITTPLGWTTAYAFAVMIGAWLATALMAWIAILKREIEIHRAWARRNYVITFAFVVFRLVTGNIPGLYDLGTVAEVFTTFGWMSWVIPLLLSELLVSAGQMARKRPSSQTI